MKMWLIPTIGVLIMYSIGCKNNITGAGINSEKSICYSKSSNIYITQFPGGTPHNISQGVQKDNNPQWSPNGRFIVYNRSLSVFGPAVIVYDLQTTNELVLTSDGGMAKQGPRWTPNGKVFFAYQRPIGSPIGTYLMNPDGTDKKRILDAVKTDSTTSIYFYPDSYTFLYVLNYTKVYKTNIEGTINEFVGDFEQIFGESFAIQDFNPGTEELFVSTNHGSNEYYTIWAINVKDKGRAIKYQSENGYTLFQFAFSHDFSKLVAIEHSDSADYLSIVQNNVKKQLVCYANRRVEDFSWLRAGFSPDGNNVVFTKHLYDLSGPWFSWTDYVCVVDVATGELHSIGEGTTPSWNPSLN
ncbi:MAG TPA: hypothetical protein VK470_08120 [Bacteroidota bacterium]|nr:hypothetical protein [Bacteroidota bacterium]